MLAYMLFLKHEIEVESSLTSFNHMTGGPLVFEIHDASAAKLFAPKRTKHFCSGRIFRRCQMAKL